MKRGDRWAWKSLVSLAFLLPCHPPKADATVRFVEQERIVLGQGARSDHATGDFDGDGDPDVIAALRFDRGVGKNQLIVVENLGDRTFRVAPPLPIEIESNERIAVGDLDLNGVADLVLSGGQWTRAFLGDGSGHFHESFRREPALPGTQLIDLDGDGLLDLFFVDGSDWSYARGTGRGGFRAPIVIGRGSRPVFGDVDGDGVTDVVFLYGYGIRVRFGDGRSGFGPAMETVLGTAHVNPTGLAVADFDGDGANELVVLLAGFSHHSSPPDSLLFLEHRPSERGVFDLAAETAVAAGGSFRGWSFQSADLNGDGIEDVQVSYRNFAGDGTGRFTRCDYAVPGPYRDMNGDGRLDASLVVCEPYQCRSDVVFLFMENRTLFLQDASRGEVNAGRGTRADVLLVNGVPGNGGLREVQVPRSSSLSVRVLNPPANRIGEAAPYAMYAWAEVPTEDTVQFLPRLGQLIALPIPPLGGSPQPAVVWNNTSVPQLGRHPRPSMGAPATLFRRSSASVLSAPVYLQGLIFDRGSSSSFPVSVTNGVLIVPTG